MGKLFVQRITRKEREEGYLEETEQTVQQLCYGRENGDFRVVDEEIIPSHVMIALGAFGDMGSDWKSKFQPWIPEAQGGTMERWQ